jgi:hypothetical protein
MMIQAKLSKEAIQVKLYRKISLFVVASVIYSFAATNDSTIDSAVLKRIYMGNYSYNTCLSSQPILSMRWASDLNRPVFKNRTGTLYKSLMDASTTSNTPQYRVFFADANGLASSSSVFTYTSGALFAPWVKGDSIYTTGKISGATLNTGNGDNELYPMNQGVRSTDDPTFDSTNVTVINATRSRTGTAYSDSIANTGGISTDRLITSGNVRVGTEFNDSWNTNFKALQVGETFSVMGIVSSTNGGANYLMSNAYYNTSNNFIARRNFGASMISLDDEEIRFSTAHVNGAGGILTFVERMALRPQGLGIGTTSPQYPLHVVGDIYTSTKVLTDTVRSKTGNNVLTLIDDNYIDLLTSLVRVGSNISVDGYIKSDSAYGVRVKAGSDYTNACFGVYNTSGSPKFTIRGDGLTTCWDALSTPVFYTDTIYSTMLNMTGGYQHSSGNYSMSNAGHMFLNRLGIGVTATVPLHVSGLGYIDSIRTSGSIVTGNNLYVKGLSAIDTGSFTATWTGFTSTTTSTIRYKNIFGVVTLFIGSVSGESNNTALETASLPSAIQPSEYVEAPAAAYATSGGSNAQTQMIAYIQGSTLSLKKTGLWGSTGTKGIDNMTITYIQ